MARPCRHRRSRQVAAHEAAADLLGLDDGDRALTVPTGQPLYNNRAGWAHDAPIGTLRRKVQDIEALQAQLAESKAHLLELMAQIEARPADMDCAANARRVLSEMKLDADAGGAPFAPGRPARP